MANSPSSSETAHRFNRELYPANSDGEPPREDVEADWSGNAPVRPDTVTISDLRPRQAFLLLGELGVGKTWLFEGESQRLQREGVKRVRFVRLGEFSDQADLESETFGHADLVQAQRHGDLMYLFLDSLDQGVLLMPQLHQWLYRRVRDNRNRSNIRIRISSRVVPQSRSLAASLADLFQAPQSDVVFYVGSLTKAEVSLEAHARRVNATRFVRAVALRNAEALAVHPLTLSLLLKEYARTKRLPADLVGLYHSACNVLVQEHETQQALDAPAVGNVAYALTGRIAALMALTGKPLFSLAPTPATPDASIGPEVVTSVPEIVNGNRVSYTYGQVRNVLANALFQAGATDAYRWIHVSLQSFMAAQWLAQRLDPEQVLGLLVHPLDARGQVRVDLEETAAWLAGMAPAIRDYLLRVQPLVLLTSQSQAGARRDPASLLRTLLLPDNAMLVRWRNVRDVRLRRLRSPMMGSILRPALDPQADRETQWLALAVIRQTGAKGFDKELLRLVDDPAVIEFVAVSAGLALETTASPATRRRIAAKLTAPNAADLPDEIKAVLLRASWPGFIPAATLFAVLTPGRDGVLGLYDTLPAKWILDNLRPDDLVHAIDWVGLQQLSGFVSSMAAQLVAGILRRAIDNIDRADVSASIVHLLQLMARSEMPFHEVEALGPLRDNLHVTRQLLAQAVEASENPVEFVNGVIWQLRPLLSSMNWLLTAYQAARTREQRAAWLWLIERTPPSTGAELQRLNTLARKDPTLSAAAKGAVVIPRRAQRPAPRPTVGTEDKADTRVSVEAEQSRLATNLERWSTNTQSAIDIADLVWKSAGDTSALRAMWASLPSSVRRQADRFFMGQLAAE